MASWLGNEAPGTERDLWSDTRSYRDLAAKVTPDTPASSHRYQRPHLVSGVSASENDQSPEGNSERQSRERRIMNTRGRLATKGSARTLLLLVAAVAALLAVMAPAGVASAQTRDGTSGPQASTTIQAVLTNSLGKKIGKIVCTGAVSKPNYESPSHKKVATAGVVLCSSRVAGIAFTLILTKDLSPVAQRGFAGLGSKRKVGDVSYSCPTNRVHRYGGVMLGTVVFPPGYVPHSGTFALASPQAHLRCR